jgi:hypothetical protein
MLTDRLQKFLDKINETEHDLSKGLPVRSSLKHGDTFVNKGDRPDLLALDTGYAYKDKEGLHIFQHDPIDNKQTRIHLHSKEIASLYHKYVKGTEHDKQ